MPGLGRIRKTYGESKLKQLLDVLDGLKADGLVSLEDDSLFRQQLKKAEVQDQMICLLTEDGLKDIPLDVLAEKYIEHKKLETKYQIAVEEHTKLHEKYTKLVSQNFDLEKEIQKQQKIIDEIKALESTYEKIAVKDGALLQQGRFEAYDEIFRVFKKHGVEIS